MHNKNKMKVTELQQIIRKVIKEELTEDVAADKAAQDAEKIATQKQIAALSKKKSELSSKTPASTDKAAHDAEKIAVDKKMQSLNKKSQSLSKPGVSSLELDEMANVAVTYELADDANSSAFTGKKNRILTAMSATGEPMSKIDVAGELGYNKQNPINADFMELVAQGVIVPTSGQAAPRLNRPAGTEPNVPAGDTEFDFIKGDMTDDEIDASFAKAAASGDEEPEIGDVEKADLVNASNVSDEDMEDSYKYTELERRLAAAKSNILKLRKGKSTAGDINDKPSTELQRLRDLKTSLEQRIADLKTKSAYVRKLSNTPEPEDIEMPDTEEEPLDEWTINKMKYYAGIIK
jgi:hypothetical protein